MSRATDGDFVIDFAESLCRQTEGQHAGRLLTLAPWQKTLLRDLFVLRPDGRRQYRKALIGMPRKNGKSSLAGVLALYLLLMDGEPGAQVYSCAGDKDQARIVFKAARRMVELEPELSACLKLYRDAIEHPGSGSVYRAVSAEAYTKEGLNPSGVIFDELHVQPNRELWDVMTLGSGTRQQPLVVAITAAGYDKDTICGELYDYGKKVLSREIADDRFFFRWWEPTAANCDYRDRAVWAETNPALGDFLHVEDLEDALQKPEAIFRRYRLNQWTSTAEAWLPHGAWDACRAPELDLDPRLPLHVGIDVALRNDSTAVVAAQKQGDRTVVRARIWENPYPLDDHRHGDWTLNIFEVEEYLRELSRAFLVPACAIDDEVKPGPEYAYDPAFFGRSAQVLEGEGLAMVEFPQHDSRMIPACQNLYQLVVEGTLAHDGDPALARHVANAAADQRPRGWRLTKKQSKRKIDAAIATAIAALRAQEPAPETPASVYEERGILSL